MSTSRFTTPRHSTLERLPRVEVRRAKAQARRETLRDRLARKLEEHADEVVAAYLAGIRSDDPNRAYRAADAWISRVHGGQKRLSKVSERRMTRLIIVSMTREQRDALKRKLLRRRRCPLMSYLERRTQI